MKQKKYITLVPVGGLANRMRAIESGISLSHKTKSELIIIWFKDWGLNCTFHELFEKICDPAVKIREATWKDKLLNDRPRKKNLFIPQIFQKMNYDTIFYETEVADKTIHNTDFYELCKEKKDIYLASFSLFYSHEQNGLPHFRPVSSLKKEIEEVTKTFNEHIIGVHIRRTDNIVSINGSPTEAFVNRMKEEIQKNCDTTFYLATDSEEEKENMKNIFGERIITSSFKADRNSTRGIKNAVVEMYILSSTTRILGSAGSSYSIIASKIGNIPYEAIKNSQ